MVSLAEF